MTRDGELSDGERLTSAYLRQRGWAYEIEPDVGGRHPDFVAQTHLGPVGFEVYEPKLLLPHEFGSFDSIGPVQGAFSKRKRQQTKAMHEAGLPVVVVIGSANADLAFDEMALQGAMFGRPGVRIPLDSTDPGADAEWTFLDGGKVRPDQNTKISALALVRSFNPTQWRVHAAWAANRLDMSATQNQREVAEAFSKMRDLEVQLADNGPFDPDARLARMIVMRNPFAALPLPIEFGGPHDDTWGTISEGGRLGFGLLCSGRFAWEIPR